MRLKSISTPIHQQNLIWYWKFYLQQFARYTNGPVFRATGAKGTKTEDDILDLLVILFAIGDNTASAKLAVTVIERLWQKKDQEKTIRLFKKNSKNFIKECAQLDKVVLMVTVLATDEILNIHNYIHCSIVNANRDEKMFQNPDELNPERSDLNKILIWNGIEEDILNPDEDQRLKRYCSGHDLSIKLSIKTRSKNPSFANINKVYHSFDE